MALKNSTGQPLPDSIEAKGLIDTGADLSAVAPAILQQLGITVHDTRESQGFGGPVQVRLFLVTLFICDAKQIHLPWLVLPDMLVIEMPTRLPVDVLIGMDVIRKCKMLVDGPGQQFLLDF